MSRRDVSGRQSASDRRKAAKRNEGKEKVRSKSFKKSDDKRDKKRKPFKEAALRGTEFEESEFETSGPRRKPGSSEKAYKLLAAQEGISNAQAKTMIDRGLVYVSNKKVMIARGELPLDTSFVVQRVEKAKQIFENSDIIVVDKPAFVNSDELERQYKGARLLHRLDRETSGVLMLVKNEEFRAKAIKAFQNNEVYKEYVAWVEGVFIEPCEIDKPILTEKLNNRAYSKVSQKGKPAHSAVDPMEVSGKRSKVKVVIQEGRTHQIRTHLRSINFPIVGDELYGGKRYKRVMLHAKKVKLLGMTFESKEPKMFAHLGLT